MPPYCLTTPVAREHRIMSATLTSITRGAGSNAGRLPAPSRSAAAQRRRPPSWWPSSRLQASAVAANAALYGIREKQSMASCGRGGNGRVDVPGLGREELQLAARAGAARNALDCTGDLAACQASPAGAPACRAGETKALVTAYTISPLARRMRWRRQRASGRTAPAQGRWAALAIPPARRSVSRGAASELIVDANEGWTPDDLIAKSGRLCRSR